MKDCPICTLFIEWLHEQAATDTNAAQLLARLHDADAEVFCEAHAHIDRRLFREFLSARREGA